MAAALLGGEESPGFMGIRCRVTPGCFPHALEDVSFGDLRCRCDTQIRRYVYISLRFCVSRSAHLVQNLHLLRHVVVTDSATESKPPDLSGKGERVR